MGSQRIGLDLVSEQKQRNTLSSCEHGLQNRTQKPGEAGGLSSGDIASRWPGLFWLQTSGPSPVCGSPRPRGGGAVTPSPEHPLGCWVTERVSMCYPVLTSPLNLYEMSRSFSLHVNTAGPGTVIVYLVHQQVSKYQTKFN